jgi:hypothetical protein
MIKVYKSYQAQASTVRHDVKLSDSLFQALARCPKVFFSASKWYHCRKVSSCPSIHGVKDTLCMPVCLPAWLPVCKHKNTYVAIKSTYKSIVYFSVKWLKQQVRSCLHVFRWVICLLTPPLRHWVPLLDRKKQSFCLILSLTLSWL